MLIVAITLFVGVCFLVWALHSQGEFLREILGHNVKMAMEYQRLQEEYKQYRADVVNSLGNEDSGGN